MQELSCNTGRTKKYALHSELQHFVLLVLFPALTIVLGPFLPATPIFAATTIPGKPAFLHGTSGNQQISLTWDAASNATGYLINEINLATGHMTRLLSAGATTSYTLTGLQIGHWYRFTITPINGVIPGPTSDPYEVRTKGFSGSYRNYYALGDSYSAGDGAPPYFGVQECYRSTKSYPYRLGAGVPRPVMIACAGAVTDNIDEIIQSPELTTTQLEQLQTGPHDDTLITITIGGNDIGFTSELTNCIVGLRSCTSRRAALSQEITELEPRLVRVYEGLRDAAPGADIISVGYPLLVAAPTRAHCHNPIVYVGLSRSEMQMIRDLAQQLDNTIAQAARQAGIYSATQQVIQAFAGHEACTANKSQEWINEIAGICDALHDSFHPNSAGYQALADAVDSARQSMYHTVLTRP